MPDTTLELVDKTTLRKVITAAAIGNFIEWFDFAIYGFLATILTKEFFPGGDLTVGLLKTFAVFAVAFAFRPLGGVFFGMIGDRIGRKKTLSATILLMAAATTLMGLLPSHAAIGFWAPALLTILRCVQAFSAGGEYAGACAYVMEHAPPGRRGYLGSFIPFTTFSTFAFAAVIAWVLETILAPEAMSSWGWRIPFLVAAPVGLIGLYLRLSLSETPAFKALEQEHAVAHAPVTEAVHSQLPGMFKLGAFISVTALSFYTFTTYFTTYLKTVAHLPSTTALLVVVLALFFAALLCPLAGLYTDWVGRRRTIFSICIFFIIVIYPAFSLGGMGYLPSALLGVALLAIPALFANVVTVPLLSEVFLTRNRYTASALTYNIAYTVFGGTAPFMATWLIWATGESMAPAFYIALISLMALIGGGLLRDTSRIRLA